VSTNEILGRFGPTWPRRRSGRENDSPMGGGHQPFGCQPTPRRTGKAPEITSLPSTQADGSGSARTDKTAPLAAGIFDVDGVLLASPHEQAWREALQGIVDPACFTNALYQAHVAGKPRLAGALAALQALGVPDPEQQVHAYAERKQKRLETLIEDGAFSAYPDGLRFAQALAALQWKLAVASSSRNANRMMQLIHLDCGTTLLDVFHVNVCGRAVQRGKPNPEIFLLAAAELRVAPAKCLVIEDAPAGIEAAHAGNMTALGVARHHDASLLFGVGADLVVTSLDEVAVDALAAGQLRRNSA
jgi:beta-phosphoglucomutase